MYLVNNVILRENKHIKISKQANRVLSNRIKHSTYYKVCIGNEECTCIVTPTHSDIKLYSF